MNNNTTTVSKNDLKKLMDDEEFEEKINRFILLYGAEIQCQDGMCAFKKSAAADRFLWLHGARNQPDEVAQDLEATRFRVAQEMVLIASASSEFGNNRRAEEFAQNNFH